jgi:hypothetical protein
MRKAEIIYQTPVVEHPIKSARLLASGGAEVRISFDEYDNNTVKITNDCKTATFDADDLGQFIEILQNMHSQLATNTK